MQSKNGKLTNSFWPIVIVHLYGPNNDGNISFGALVLQGWKADDDDTSEIGDYRHDFVRDFTCS